MITTDWNKYIGLLPPDKRDVYFTEEYHKLNASSHDIPEAYVYQKDDNILIFPFLSRITTIQGVSVKDFETAYGYGGPICNTDDKSFINEALLEFSKEAKNEGFIAGFVRFHPLFDNYLGFDSIGDLIFNRNTIAIDLSGEENEIWLNEIHTKNRNVIKKGAKLGLTFTADYEYSSLEQFKELYRKTMDKLSAEDFYYFDDNYFSRFCKDFPNSFIGTVKLENQIIAAAIFFFQNAYGHYHLAGSDIDYLKYSPNNFLLWNAAMELKKQGVKLFHLGGGTDGDENNSLFQFKRKFSKSLQNFYIGKAIFNKELYEHICKCWANENPDKEAKYGSYLLKYRF